MKPLTSVYSITSWTLKHFNASNYSFIFGEYLLAFQQTYPLLHLTINHEFIYVNQILCDMQTGIKRQQIHFSKFQLHVDGTKVHETE